MPTDGARVRLPLHVYASSKGEGRGSGGAGINQRRERRDVLSRNRNIAQCLYAEQHHTPFSVFVRGKSLF